MAGFTHKVFQARDELVRSQIEAHAPKGERYTLVARVVNVGVALLVYVRDEQLGQRIRDVQTQWTGCGPGWMGNKGAVGVRFRIDGTQSGTVGETFTFVYFLCCLSFVANLLYVKIRMRPPYCPRREA